MQKRLAIWGWWQGRNLGDNWIRHVMSDIFPSAVFIDTTVKDFSDYAFVICGGGGIFIYGVHRHWQTHDLNIPFGMLGLGAEFPHKNDMAYQLSRKAAFFFIRDNDSLECMHVHDRARSYDITFFAPLQWRAMDALNMQNVFFVWRDGKEWSDKEYFKEYICYEDNYEQYNEIIHAAFNQVIANDFQTTDDDAEAMIKDSGFVISGRFHGIVAAIQKGLPCIAIDICPKIRWIMRDCGLEDYCIKINEVARLNMLIDKARIHVVEIREKQQLYTKKANKQLIKDVAVAKAAVSKACG